MNKIRLNRLKENNNFFVILFLLLFQVVLYTNINAQTLTVKGRVAATRFSVKEASITFIDNADTTRKFSALTDASGNYQVSLVVTGVEEDPGLPTKFELAQNYPNPFSSTTAIPYGLKQESNIQVIIYDILGRIVRKFDVGYQTAGAHNILWDGRNNLGQRIASGIYFYRLNAGGESQVKKMIFNQGGKDFAVIPHSYSLTGNSFSRTISKAENIQGNTFTIRVQNTSSTTPLIIPVELENVVLTNDTTINFSVGYIPLATINIDSLHQHISGFGAANIIGGGWRPDMTSSEIETAFGTGDGQLGFSILRLRISPNPNDFAANITTAKAAYDMGVKIIASPWSPPASMKTNNNLVGGELKEDAYGDYANHLNSFVDLMSNNGVPVYAVSVQNEPDISVSYESCDWNPQQMVKFMSENASSIGTRVMAPESYQFRRIMSDPILNDSTALANLDIVAGHIYGGGLFAYPLAEEKGKEIWMTEYLLNSGNPPTNLSIDTGWTGAFQTAESINNCMNANMSAYVWWYIVRYYGPIADGTYANKGDVTKKGYVMSQFARFIRPGFYRVESSVTPSPSNINVTAYKDPLTSKVVIVAINSGTNQAETVFRIQNDGVIATFTPYTTTQTKNCEQGELFNVADGSFTFTLEPSSITTFVSN
jgi:glucuronoarabinoxylan endo-1,4-beta-xylanase